MRLLFLRLSSLHLLRELDFRAHAARPSLPLAYVCVFAATLQV